MHAAKAKEIGQAILNRGLYNDDIVYGRLSFAIYQVLTTSPLSPQIDWAKLVKSTMDDLPSDLAGGQQAIIETSK